MPVIKTRGAKPASAGRKAKAKPAATRKSPARKAVAKQAERINRSSKTDLPASQVNKILRPLTAAAKSREKNHTNWKADVAEVNELIVDALNAEIPVHMIVEAAQVSRQQVYKIITDIRDGKRTDDGLATGKAGRPPAKRTAATTKKIGSTRTKTVGRSRSASPGGKRSAKRVIRTR